MPSEMKPGATFPDYVLPDHTQTPRRLSALQGDDPMVLVLTRGAFCPKDRAHHHELVRFYPELVVGFTKIATITTDDWHLANNMRQQTNAQWPFLYDEDRTIQKDFDIKEYTDTEHDIMVPHTLLLRPGLVIERVWNGYWYWGRPSMAELHQSLRDLTRDIRPDWDITTPEMKAAFERGEKEPFFPYGKRSMTEVLTEMSGAVDQYAGSA